MGLCGSACRYTFHVCKKRKKKEEEDTGQNQAMIIRFSSVRGTDVKNRNEKNGSAQ